MSDGTQFDLQAFLKTVAGQAQDAPFAEVASNVSQIVHREVSESVYSFHTLDWVWVFCFGFHGTCLIYLQHIERAVCWIHGMERSWCTQEWIYVGHQGLIYSLCPLWMQWPRWLSPFERGFWWALCLQGRMESSTAFSRCISSQSDIDLRV